MAFRLILVGLVAALGLTIPGTPAIESWVAPIQDWMNARLAGWDTRNLQSTGHGIATACRAAGLPVRQPSQLAVALINPEALSRPVNHSESLVRKARASRVRPVKFAPKCNPCEALGIGEKPATDIVFRLNLRNGHEKVSALEGPPAPLSSRVKFDAAWALGKAARHLTASLDNSAAALSRSLPRFSSMVAPHPKNEPGPRAKACTTELAEDLTSKTQERSIRFEKAAAPQRPTIALESFGAMEQSGSLYFAGDLPQVFAPLAVKPDSKPCALEGERAKVGAVAAWSSITASAPAVVDDAYEEISESLRPVDDGLGRPVAKTTARQQPPLVAPEMQIVARKSAEVARMPPRSAIKPRFEPLEVGEDRCADIAFGLNPRRDGSKNAAVPAITTVAPVPTALPLRRTKTGFVPSRPAPDLSRAVKLTREAVCAWVEVLAGPAIVTVGQPSSEGVE